MEFYHGTTLNSARGIIENGFRPRGGAVWFTNSWDYAKNRAEQIGVALSNVVLKNGIELT